ncbi:hypothetical protein [Streptomyces flavofungini]|uniref:DUF1877 family protein n=1 Tax=Streptomyces flavofungini TaxID=68200 RepID=A0ABS0X8C2_9ACTN|nr:hypothetical protein [Streptomyces flavofungini]MBJ3809450.1 hypothetical protein [Streptomyces flavofungini]
MGLSIEVLIADAAWLGEVPLPERLSRLRDAWYADETGLWDLDAGAAQSVEGDWQWPQGPDSAYFGVYAFRRTLGSYKPHFWAGERWEDVRDHADPVLRAALDALLLGLIWCGPDGEDEHTDPGVFGDGPAVSNGVLLARAPDSVRRLAATWERLRPRLGGLRAAFTAHAATPQEGGWISSFDEFTDLLEDWGRVLTEADRRGWCVVGLKD